jgi:hypothetical protein
LSDIGLNLAFGSSSQTRMTKNRALGELDRSFGFVVISGKELPPEAWSSSYDLLGLLWRLDRLDFSVRNVLLQGVTKFAVERCSFFCLFA